MAEALTDVIETALSEVTDLQMYSRPHEVQQVFQELADTQHRNIHARFITCESAAGEFQIFALDAKDANPNGNIGYLKDGVHSNELVGKATTVELAQQVCKNPALMHELGLKTILFFDADPEGTNRNGDSLFRGELTIENYLLGVHRSSAHPDLKYPGQYKDYSFSPDPKNDPATLHSKHIIDHYQPNILLSLHNAGLGKGPYWYINQYLTEFNRHVPSLMAANDMSNYGISEFNNKKFAPGVYQATTLEYLYERQKRGLKKLYYGKGSPEYLSDTVPHALGTISEVPYFISTTGHISSREKCTEDQKDLRQFLDLGENVLRAIDSSLLQEDGEAYRKSGHHIIRALQAHCYDMELDKLAKEIPERHMFYTAVGLNSVRQAALHANKNSLAQEIEDHIREIAKRTDEALQPHATTRQQQVRIQMGTFLLGAYVQQTRIKAK